MAPKKDDPTIRSGARAELEQTGDGEPHGLASMIEHREAEFPDEKPDPSTIANVEVSPTVSGGPATEATAKAAEEEATSAAEARASNPDTD